MVSPRLSHAKNKHVCVGKECEEREGGRGWNLSIRATVTPVQTGMYVFVM